MRGMRTQRMLFQPWGVGSLASVGVVGTVKEGLVESTDRVDGGN